MITALMLSLALAAPPPTAAAAPADVLAAFVAAFNARDAARTASLYGPDAELMPPDGPPVKGTEAIEAALREQFRVVRALDLLSVNAGISGNLAYVTGRLTVSTRTPDHRADIASGSYLVVLRLTRGEWKIAYHMFNLPLRPDFVG